ncbi:hypothetical protein CHS0354_013060 [Potamilus streckersoni]|uniref:Uncharacterized protein n=1 Tax=Potamilus streckersoni TaxID=2493646 RepID=A0AAE0S010_9BIVA|nr:hypothetical protein CHS0354_013060 [Potamilus streckersoni]
MFGVRSLAYDCEVFASQDKCLRLDHKTQKKNRLVLKNHHYLTRVIFVVRADFEVLYVSVTDTTGTPEGVRCDLDTMGPILCGSIETVTIFSYDF